MMQGGAKLESIRCVAKYKINAIQSLMISYKVAICHLKRSGIDVQAGEMGPRARAAGGHWPVYGAARFPKELTMFEIMAVTKALADENRVRLLAALEKSELCVCQLIELIELAPSTVSKHLSILRSARLIDARKDGRWMYYRLAESGASQTVTGALAWLKASMRDNPRIRADRQRLANIMQTDPGVLCSQHARERDKPIEKWQNP